MMRKVSDKSLLSLIHSVVVNVTYFSLIGQLAKTLSVQRFYQKRSL